MGRTDIAGLGAHVVPVAIFRNRESVRLRKPGQLLISSLINDFLVLLVPGIADALKEQQGKDIGLEVSRIHRGTQDVSRLPEAGLKLTEGNGLFWHNDLRLLAVLKRHYRICQP